MTSKFPDAIVLHVTLEDFETANGLCNIPQPAGLSRTSTCILAQAAHRVFPDTADMHTWVDGYAWVKASGAYAFLVNYQPVTNQALQILSRFDSPNPKIVESTKDLLPATLTYMKVKS